MAAEKQVNINASLFKYLYDNLEVPYGVRIFDNIFYQDFSGLTKWCVLDILSNRLGVVPVQLVFLHLAVQKTMENASEELDNLLDLTIPLFENGQPIDVYDRTSGLIVGGMAVIEPSLSPVLEHPGGGLKRTMTIGLLYQGN